MDTPCIICHETVKKGEPQVGYKKCRDKHVFHTNCLENWMKSENYDDKCPLCRIISKLQIIVPVKLSLKDQRVKDIFENNIRKFNTKIPFSKYLIYYNKASLEFRSEMDSLFVIKKASTRICDCVDKIMVYPVSNKKELSMCLTSTISMKEAMYRYEAPIYYYDDDGNILIPVGY